MLLIIEALVEQLPACSLCRWEYTSCKAGINLEEKENQRNLNQIIDCVALCSLESMYQFQIIEHCESHSESD